MTGREAYDIFQSIVDNYTDEYVSEVDFSRLFNTAQKQLLMSDLNPFYEKRAATEQPRNSIESTQVITEYWDALIEYDAATVISSGSILLSLIEATFPNTVKRDEVGLIATEKPKILHLMSLAVSTDGVNYKMAKWRRHNDRLVIKDDPFRVPDSNYPSYWNAENSWRVEPTSFVQALATVVREPIDMWYESGGSNNVDPELKDSTCIRVIELAAKNSAISHRDAALADKL